VVVAISGTRPGRKFELVKTPRTRNTVRDVRRRSAKAEKSNATGAAHPDITAAAIRYDPVTAQSAPSVVASGRGWLAERILEVARDHGITVREDADLVEILTAVEIGDEVPVEAFVAVAEILRYIYAANGTKPPEYPKS
jgi:flagellar biosynthesis protein